jgi:N utilization substance protein B
MALPPQKFREIVLQLLYSHDFAENSPESIPFMMEALKVARHYVIDANLKVQAILERLPELDERIRKSSTEYTLDRISKVELTILRLGIYELLYEKDIPPKVALAEAIRLCRKFGTPESAHFVNAILDEIYDPKTATADGSQSI